MRTYNSRVTTYNNVSKKMASYGAKVGDSIMDGANVFIFDMSYVIWPYLTDSIGAQMENVDLADKELDYLIKNV